MNFSNLFATATGGRDPFPWQVRFAESADLAKVLRIPTGGGKTEGAVLGWLWQRRFAADATRRATPRRLVYCLPMRVLVEQTVSRCEEMIKLLGLADDVRVHQLMGGSVASDWKHEPEADQILVGTLDQLLSRALMRGYGVSRYQWPVDFALLHNDVLWVYDEVQLFGEALATSTQLEGIRQALPSGFGPSASLWMSATVDPSWLETVDHSAPSSDRILELGPPDLLGPLAKRLSAVKRLSYIDGIDAARISAGHQPGTLTLVVLNTVNAARELYYKLTRSKDLRGAELVLLHSRFRSADRLQAIDRLLAEVNPEGPGRIVISTQVIEAGVDVSAALLVTEAAPWANLIQRFGRCNRFGELTDAEVLWSLPSKSLPYEEAEVASAVATLRDLEGASVAPLDLEAVDAPLIRPPCRFVLRKRDFLGLFDTAPDLTGLDLDVSRFIRDGDDLAASVAWRPLNGAPPNDEAAALRASELCPAPLSELRKLLLSSGPALAWRFDTVASGWVRADAKDLRPGVRLLADAAVGWYTPEGGFDPKSKVLVSPVEIDENVDLDGFPEGFGDDAATEVTGSWLTLREHTEGVLATLVELLESVESIGPEEHKALLTAAQLHDWGKSHDVFQEAMHATVGLVSPPESAVGAILAKRVGKAPRYGRAGFRHELASLLAYLATHTDPEPLVAYLIAAHHGRIRLGARSIPSEAIRVGRVETTVLGCAAGDTLPEVERDGATQFGSVTLTLDSLALGATSGKTFTDIALELLDEMGPVRLAFLEMLLRTADTRRSRREALEAR